MPAAWLRVFALALLALLAAGARAQIPVELREHTPAEMAREAFASDYGRLLAAEFGRILRESADADCQQARKLDSAGLAERGRDLLVRQGTRMLDTYWKLYDTRRFDAALMTGGGINAKSEITRLRKDPEVRKLLDLYQPAKLAAVADSVTDIIDRYALLRGIRLNRRISPLASGNTALLKTNPTDRSAEDAERFLKSSKSPQVKRWVALEEVILKAAEQSLDRDAMAKVGPAQLGAGLEAEFAELCVAAAR